MFIGRTVSHLSLWLGTCPASQKAVHFEPFAFDMLQVCRLNLEGPNPFACTTQTTTRSALSCLKSAGWGTAPVRLTSASRVSIYFDTPDFLSIGFSDLFWHPLLGTRIGEASNPGPQVTSQTLTLAVLNPTVLTERQQDIVDLGADIISLSETSATKAIQSEFTKFLVKTPYKVSWSPL